LTLSWIIYNQQRLHFKTRETFYMCFITWYLRSFCVT